LTSAASILWEHIEQCFHLRHQTAGIGVSIHITGESYRGVKARKLASKKHGA